MSRELLERFQVWFYLAGAVLGLALGSLSPSIGATVEALVWPVIAVLLFATFTQIPVTALREAVRDQRFLTAALVGNFVLIPLVVWGLVQLVPQDAALRLGLLLVLLVPCTDWFITFTQLGQGDASRATAASPLLLVVQLLLLPVYLALFTDGRATSVFTLAELWPALLVIGVPLGLAVALARWFEASPGGRRVRGALGVWPVPALSVVIALVAAAHVGAALESLALFPVVAVVVVAYLVVALALAAVLARVFALGTGETRTLAFSLGTRNSFLVLPFALALPEGWAVVPIVIVMQSLLELFGMIFFLWFVPRYVHGAARS